MDSFPMDRETARGTKFERMWETPEHWPRSVRFVPISDFDHLGMDPKTMQLYWDGKALVTEKRFSTQERLIGWIGLLLAAVGVAATVVQAWAALLSIPPAT